MGHLLRVLNGALTQHLVSVHLARSTLRAIDSEESGAKLLLAMDVRRLAHAFESLAE